MLIEKKCFILQKLVWVQQMAKFKNMYIVHHYLYLVIKLTRSESILQRLVHHCRQHREDNNQEEQHFHWEEQQPESDERHHAPS